MILKIEDVKAGDELIHIETGDEYTIKSIGRGYVVFYEHGGRWEEACIKHFKKKEQGCNE